MVVGANRGERSGRGRLGCQREAKWDGSVSQVSLLSDLERYSLRRGFEECLGNFQRHHILHGQTLEKMTELSPY